MLTNKDYFPLAAKGVYVVSEMDREYNRRSQRLMAANQTGNTYSVAKLFTVTAVGMCVDRGYFDTSDKFVDIMGISLPAGCDKKWHEVTVDMLLSHRWGVSKGGLLDIDVDNAAEYPTEDYLSLVMQQPLDGVLGVDFCYTDAAYYLLSLLVEKTSGKPLAEFLRPALMGTMKFAELAWSACPKGHSMGATGLYLRCEDVAKLGVLYLNGGVWQGERVLSKRWCDTVFERQYEFSSQNGGWYCKVGMYGQMLAVNPEKALSVACMGHSRAFKITDIL